MSLGHWRLLMELGKAFYAQFLDKKNPATFYRVSWVFELFITNLLAQFVNQSQLCNGFG
ncbi:MAG: hypothetical protein ACJAWT_000717 [Glaciecola sp.]|jgi:hypothetical protein